MRWEICLQQVADRVIFMDGVGIVEEGRPSRFFIAPQRAHHPVLNMVRQKDRCKGRARAFGGDDPQAGIPPAVCHFAWQGGVFLEFVAGAKRRKEGIVMNCAIRQVTAADVDAVTRLEAKCFRPTRRRTEVFARRIAAFGDSFVAEQDGDPGMINGCVTDQPRIPGRHVPG